MHKHADRHKQKHNFYRRKKKNKVWNGHCGCGKVINTNSPVMLSSGDYSNNKCSMFQPATFPESSPKLFPVIPSDLSEKKKEKRKNNMRISLCTIVIRTHAATEIICYCRFSLWRFPLCSSIVRTLNIFQINRSLFLSVSLLSRSWLR